MESKLVGLALAAAVLLGVAWLFASFLPPGAFTTDDAPITSFEECAAAGYPVMESYPRQCMANGQNFVEDITSGMPVPGEIVSNGCAVAGCSSQLCVSADEADEIVSTCEYRAEYACYREASCEPQANGECGWTQTAELKQCLANPPALDEKLQTI